MFPNKIHFQTGKYLEAKVTSGAVAGFLAVPVLTPARPSVAGTTTGATPRGPAALQEQRYCPGAAAVQIPLIKMEKAITEVEQKV